MMLSRPSKKNLQSEADQILNPLFTELEETLEATNDGQSSVRGEQRLIAWHDNSLFSTGNQPQVSSFDGNPDFFDRDFSSFDEEDDVPEETFSSPPLWLRHLDKIIFTSSCSLLVWVLFLLQREEQLLAPTLSQVQPPITLSETEVPEAVDNRNEFITYMERALAQIEQRSEQAEALKTKAKNLTPAVTPSAEIPPVSTTPTSQKQVAVASSSASKPPSQEQTAAASSSPPQANQGGGNTEISSLPALPPPPPSQSQPRQSSPQTQSSSPENSNEKTSEASETSPTQETSEDSTATEQSLETSEPSSPSRDQTLVGLLELGEHSAALLKVKGVTQRIMIGETVPNSNWTLAEISNEKAKFKKDGREKSMSVGESLINR